MRLFCQRELAEILGNRQVVQINQSRTKKKGAVRGLHFQYPPHAEMKLVRCVKGRVWDVAVDLRAGSSTFLKWIAEELSAENHFMMVIPEGCAHGFQVLEANSELVYLHSAFYTPESEGGARYDDPILGISWPRKSTDISEHDQAHPLIGPAFQGMYL